jgi:hypothetical protein
MTKKIISDIEVAKKIINIYQSAQDRKIDFNLSFEYVKNLLEYKNCYYTDIPFTDDGIHARSFDRIDSDKGYIEGNVVACTIDINGKKANLSFEEIECLYNKLCKHSKKNTDLEIKTKRRTTKTKKMTDDKNTQVTKPSQIINEDQDPKIKP